MATASVTNALVTATTIVVSALNTNFQDLVTFLNNSVLHRDGSKSMTGVLDMGNQRIENLLTGVNLTDAATRAEAKNASILDSGVVPVGVLPDASTSAQGVVQLNNTLTSTAVDEALTANQGKNLREQRYAHAGDATAYPTRKIWIQSSTPTMSDGDIWFDTSA